jgi:hypothetical protein
MDSIACLVYCVPSLKCGAASLQRCHERLSNANYADCSLCSVHICEIIHDLFLFHGLHKGLTHVLLIGKFYKVHTKARIVAGDPGTVICREAERLKPAAVILGTRGRGLVQRYLTPKPHLCCNCRDL